MKIQNEIDTPYQFQTQTMKMRSHKKKNIQRGGGEDNIIKMKGV